MTPPKHYCRACGGTNVQHAVWVRLNTNEVLEAFGSWCYGDNSWCEDCETHVQIGMGDDDDEG